MARKDFTVAGTMSDGRVLYFGKKEPDSVKSRDLTYWVTTTCRSCSGYNYVRLDGQLGMRYPADPADPPDSWKSKYPEQDPEWWTDRAAAVAARLRNFIAELDPKEYDRQVAISRKNR